MTFSMRGVRLGLGLLAAGTIMSAASGAAAQSASFPAGAVVQPLGGGDNGAELRRHLTELADNPRSLSALVGAGRAALATGDTQAALAFFARADEVAPRDARVKAGMASALVHMEQPRTALAYFAEAVAMGAPEVEIAADRGLAYDMVGDPRRAQQDYALALRRGENDEVRRRLALSLAISGQRDAALRAIDDQLRRNDRAAWRTRALILAVSGDWPAAVEAAGSTMPGPSAQAMAPFLARLHGLSPAQKAMAVHFGHFPADGQATASARPVDTSAYPGALALAGGGGQQPVRTASAQPGGQAALRRRNLVPEPVSTAPRRRPGATAAPERYERVNVGSRGGAPRFERRDGQQQQAQPAPVQHAQAAQPQPQTLAQLAQAQPQPTVQQPPPQPAVVHQPPAEQPPAGQPVSFAAAAAPAPVPQPRDEGPGFEQVAALVAALPTEPQAVPASTRPSPPPPVAATRPAPPPAASPPAASPQRQAPARAAAPVHPSRHWVQIAGGADRTALPREFARLRGLAPDLLDDKAPHTTPLRYTNRLLVGPFDSEREAQEFVNRLARHEVAAFAWTSPAGQEIERLRTR